MVSHEELKAILDEFKLSMENSLKQVALNHTVNRPQATDDPKPGTSGISHTKAPYNPMSDSGSEMDSDLEQFGSDLDIE